MKKYNLDITISNDHGEQLDKRFSFDSFDEVNMFMTNSAKMHELWNEAENNGKEEGTLYEELFDSKKEAEIAMENGLTSDDMTNFN